VGGATYFMLKLFESCEVVILRTDFAGYELAFCILFLIYDISFFFVARMVIWD
jgi:hypothetical protein